MTPKTTNEKFGYFGDPKFRKEWEIQVPPPVDETCPFCEEQIADGDTGTVRHGQAVHYECMMRQIVGSVGHQTMRCSCYGGVEEDPPGMSKREAAQTAVKLWNLTHD